VGVLGTLVWPNRCPESDTHLIYTGSWATEIDPYCSGWTSRSASTPGSSVTISFNGVNLRLVATKTRLCGKASVSLDGGTPVLVDLYSGRTRFREAVWSTGFLAPGKHTVTMSWSGDVNRRALGTSINLDTVEVIGALW
jgi:hypothetical protein